MTFFNSYDILQLSFPEQQQSADVYLTRLCMIFYIGPCSAKTSNITRSKKADLVFDGSAGALSKQICSAFRLIVPCSVMQRCPAILSSQ